MNANDATVARLEQALLGTAPQPSIMRTSVPYEVTDRMVQAFVDRASPGGWLSMTDPQRQICRENFQAVWDAVLEVAS